jgi:hypothetical protein
MIALKRRTRLFHLHEDDEFLSGVMGSQVSGRNQTFLIEGPRTCMEPSNYQ